MRIGSRTAFSTREHILSRSREANPRKEGSSSALRRTSSQMASTSHWVPAVGRLRHWVNPTTESPPGWVQIENCSGFLLKILTIALWTFVHSLCFFRSDACQAWIAILEAYFCNCEYVVIRTMRPFFIFLKAPQKSVSATTRASSASISSTVFLEAVFVSHPDRVPPRAAADIIALRILGTKSLIKTVPFSR